MNNQYLNGAALDLAIEDLESLEAPDDAADFFAGVGIGLAIVGLAVLAT